MTWFMRRPLLCVATFAACVFCSAARADLSDQRLVLFIEAAEAAAELDAIDAYCKAQKPDLYADHILGGAARQTASTLQKAQIKDKIAQVQSDVSKKLLANKPDCKDVEFMFDQYAKLDRLDRQIKALVDGWRDPAKAPPGAL